jgi:hypothetical protein
MIECNGTTLFHARCHVPAKATIVQERNFTEGTLACHGSGVVFDVQLIVVVVVIE